MCYLTCPQSCPQGHTHFTRLTETRMSFCESLAQSPSLPAKGLRLSGGPGPHGCVMAPPAPEPRTPLHPAYQPLEKPGKTKKVRAAASAFCRLCFISGEANQPGQGIINCARKEPGTPAPGPGLPPGSRRLARGKSQPVPLPPPCLHWHFSAVTSQCTEQRPPLKGKPSPRKGRGRGGGWLPSLWG